MPNRLAKSSSPYLRQHKDNPVDWYPWCDEAFEKAKSEDKPIFLSVGYSACHWCHVMEHESFENEDLAKILNDQFVSIKVDREERPDVDQVYMQAVQMLTGSGGWPMSVFMSHDGKPFYGGTYWPPDSRYGRPGFGQVLLAVSDAWQNKREQIGKQGEQICQHLHNACRGPDQVESPLDSSWLTKALSWLEEHHDASDGGFGGAPKFPHAMDLSLLIESSSLPLEQQREYGVKPESLREVVGVTLDKMASGGIYDHLGGGFARYSVDAKWLVPHFEKMLYDNALLTCCYADAYRLWGEERYAQVVRETLDYVIRDMTNEQGGYFSTEDADSEGVEGKYYVWSAAEIVEVLGSERGRVFCSVYDVSEGGNFEGSNILNLPIPLADHAARTGIDLAQLQSELASDRVKLLQRRSTRVRPGLDDKVLVSWNALMITAMTRGFRALGEPVYLDSALRAVDFFEDNMVRPDGRLWHTWREGMASIDGYLDDYAYMIDALCELFQVHPSVAVLQRAINLAEILLASFCDPDGGFFFTSDDAEPLIARSKDLADSSVPSGNAMAASALLTLSQLTGREDLRSAAESALIASSGVMSSSPQAAGQALRVLQRFVSPRQELVLLGGSSENEALRQQVLKKLDPLSVVTVHRREKADQKLQDVCPLVADRVATDDQITLFVCKDSVCNLPLTGADLLSELGAES